MIHDSTGEIAPRTEAPCSPEMDNNMGAERPRYTSPKSILVGRTITAGGDLRAAFPVLPTAEVDGGTGKRAPVPVPFVPPLRERAWALGPITALRTLSTPI